MRRKKRQARGPHEHTRSTRLFFLLQNVRRIRVRRVVVCVRPKGVGWKRPRWIDALFSEGSEPSSTSDATTARWYEAFETRVAASQSLRRSKCNPLRNKASTEGIRTFGCRLDARKRNSRVPSFHAVTGGTRYRQPSRGRYRRPCRLFCPPEREAGAVALASRARKHRALPASC